MALGSKTNANKVSKQIKSRFFISFASFKSYCQASSDFRGCSSLNAFHWESSLCSNPKNILSIECDLIKLPRSAESSRKKLRSLSAFRGASSSSESIFQSFGMIGETTRFAPKIADCLSCEVLREGIKWPFGSGMRARLFESQVNCLVYQLYSNGRQSFAQYKSD